jgi:hypothetical protein
MASFLNKWKPGSAVRFWAFGLRSPLHHNEELEQARIRRSKADMVGKVLEPFRKGCPQKEGRSRARINASGEDAPECRRSSAGRERQVLWHGKCGFLMI